MPDTLDDYFRQVSPVFPREPGMTPLEAKAALFRSIGNLSRTLYDTTPAALDRARGFRNRFIRAVQ